MSAPSLVRWSNRSQSFSKASRFAGGEVAEQKHGFLGLGEAEADGAVVMDENEIVGRQRIELRRIGGLAERWTLPARWHAMAQAEDRARLGGMDTSAFGGTTA